VLYLRDPVNVPRRVLFLNLVHVYNKSGIHQRDYTCTIAELERLMSFMCGTRENKYIFLSHGMSLTLIWRHRSNLVPPLTMQMRTQNSYVLIQYKQQTDTDLKDEAWSPSFTHN